MITSLQNARVKEAVKLRDARGRRTQERIIIDGARELRHAIQGGLELLNVFVCNELCQSQECRELLALLDRQVEGRRTEVLEVSPAVFEKLAFGERAEGVVGVARTPSTNLEELKLPDNPLIAVLEGAEKPGNVGAVLRSADGAGISALIVADGGTDLYNPNAIRASLGTIFTMPVCSAASEEVLRWLAERQIDVYAAWVDAEEEYTQADFARPCAIVLGSEAQGLSESWRPNVNGPDEESYAPTPRITAIGLPMLGAADSLNVSTAAAVLFYEALRQRRANK